MPDLHHSARRLADHADGRAPASGRRSLKAARLFAASAACALATGVSAGACAAEAEAEAAELGEVVVTARHRTETAQTVPAALSVIGGEFLEKTNTNNIAQLSRYVPTVQFSFFNARNANINIRGLGNNIGVASDGIEPGVGFYVDQVYYSRPATATFDLVDIQRVEVLRGPQGTLFGKDTTAGAIALRTAEPTFTPEGVAELTGGSHALFQAKAAVSGPLLDDRLAGRLTLATSTRGGFLTNDFTGDKVNGSRSLNIRGQLLFQPSADLDFRLIADYAKQKTNCCVQVLSGVVTPPNGKNFLNLAASFGYTPVIDPFARRANINSDAYARQETGGVSLQADWNTRNHVLTSVTAWRFWNWWPANDVDYTPLSVMTAAQNRDYQEQFSQELRIASDSDGPLEYVGGLFFFHEQIRAVGKQSYGDAASAFMFGPAVPAIVADGYRTDYGASYNTSSLAAFGQATWRFLPQWSLTAGLRYTYDRKNGHFNQVASGGAPLTGPLAAFAPLRAALGTNAALAVSDSHGAFSGQLNLAYEPTDDVLTYVNLARGSKSGGLNLTQLPPNASLVIRPETIDSIEAGVKSRFFDRRLTVNGAVFFQRDENYQGNLVVPGTVKLYLSNIPEVQVRGVELDVRAEPAPWISIYASGVFNQARYESYPAAPCGLENVTQQSCDLSGRALAGVPRWSLSAGVELRRPVTLGAREAEFYLAVDEAYRSSLYSAATDSIYSRLPALTLVDARLGVRAADGSWDAYVWGKNVTDEQYFLSTGPGLGNTGALVGSLGDPATWGVTLRARY